MKIFDCVPYFDENMLFDLRLNILNKYVDKFVVVEQLYTHSGKKKRQNFDLNNFSKFKDKIIYFLIENEPDDLFEIDPQNPKHHGLKRINSLRRISLQYNKLIDGLRDAGSDDLILVSDCDEIPDLKNFDFKGLKEKIILFGLPGAFTPTCSSKHLPGYENLYDEFKELGIDEIYCVSVNDVYVIKKWKEYENINKVKLIADGTCSFTRSIGMNVNWIKERGFGERSWRYSAYIENGIVINSFIESPFKDESVEDPFEVSDAETMLSYLKEKLRIKV